MNIPIVAISDKKQAFILATLFINLLETKSENSFYELNALVTPDFLDEDVEKIKSIQSLYKEQCTINIIKIDNRFDNIKNKTGYIANACTYKFCLAEKFPEYNKVIYLDTDILVFQDLTELYNYNIDEYYIGGCFSIEHYLFRQDLIEKLAIPNLLSYINAGVMLLNLDMIRKHELEPKLQSLIGSYNDSVDQHIFNKCCFGKIKLIPQKWNVYQTSEKINNSQVALIYMTEAERSILLNSPGIYHYTGKSKPWKFYNLKYSLIWLRYYYKSPFGEQNLCSSFSSDSSCKYNLTSPKDFNYYFRKYKHYKKYKFLYKIFRNNKYKKRIEDFEEEFAYI